MKSETDTGIQATDLALPLVRPLVALTQCDRVLAERGARPVPLVLARVMALNLGYLASTLQELGKRGAVQDPDLRAVVGRLRRLASTDARRPASSALRQEIRAVGELASTWKKPFRVVAAEHGAAFAERYREQAGRVRLQLLHAPADATAASRIARTLRDECWYDVTTRLVRRGPDDAPTEDMRLFYATDAGELSRCLETRRPAVVLADVGPARRGYDVMLGRTLARIDVARTPILNRPFLAVRLLGTIERVRIARLVALERRVLVRPRRPAGASTLRLLRVLRRVYERPVASRKLEVPAELWIGLEQARKSPPAPRAARVF